MNSPLLYKTTLIIWSKFDPRDYDISLLAYEAEQGYAYCSSQKHERIEHPEQDEHWAEVDTDYFPWP
jgi:hypothetical protein